MLRRTDIQDLLRSMVTSLRVSCVLFAVHIACDNCFMIVRCISISPPSVLPKFLFLSVKYPAPFCLDPSRLSTYSYSISTSYTVSLRQFNHIEKYLFLAMGPEQEASDFPFSSPFLFLDTRSVLWTDGRDGWEEYFKSVTSWSSFHDMLLDYNATKIKIYLWGIMLKSQLFSSVCHL